MVNDDSGKQIASRKIYEYGYPLFTPPTGRKVFDQPFTGQVETELEGGKGYNIFLHFIVYVYNINGVLPLLDYLETISGTGYCYATFDYIKIEKLD